MIAKRSIESPVKLTISASWLRCSCKKINFSIKPISALNIAMKNMTTPKKMCHGANLALVEDSAPGKKNEKKAKSHCKIKRIKSNF